MSLFPKALNYSHIKSEVKEKILFDRQFLISSEKENFPDMINLQLGKYFVHIGRKLSHSSISDGKTKLLVLGSLYDYRHPSASNEDILTSLRFDGKTEELLEDVSFLCGNYLLFLEKPDGIILIPDMASSKEAYIDLNEDEITIASSISLLSQVKNLKEVDSGTFISTFYSSPEFQSRRIQVGNSTRFKGVVRARANHIFDFKSRQFQRFFPRHPISPDSLDNVSEKASLILTGILKSISQRGRMLLPITAGWDSRLLLACARGIQDEVIFYLLKHNSIPQLSQDVVTSKKLFKRLKIPFQLIEYSDHVPEEVRKSTRKKMDMPNEQSMAYIFNAWQKLFPSFISINGNFSEITRNEWGVTPKVNEKLLAALAKYPDNAFCHSLYRDWLAQNNEHFTKLGYQTLDMFYWEEIMANRIAQAYTEINLGIEMASPFNCNALIRILLSVPAEYRGKQYNILYKQMISKLWPELLDVPINPGLKKTIIRIMQRIGVYDWYRNTILNSKYSN
ncbi:MAG TPA: hypothetical protein VIT44_13535 [Cyclobacteriaceae bacterium]